MSMTETSSLRERQRGLARNLILDAASRAILTTGVHQFSMQQVADEAQVSLRTLYRYFRTREELLEGLGEHMTDLLSEHAPLPAPAEFDVDSFADFISGHFAVLTAHGDLARAWLSARDALGAAPASTRERMRYMLDVVEHLTPGLSGPERRRVAGVLRLLGGSRAWKTLTVEVGLSAEEAGEAVGWAVRALLADLEAACERPPGRS